MKLSDYVAQFLHAQGIRHVFAVAGGACLHLIDSIARAEGIDYVCPHHEQAGAMAADGYARVTGNLGAAIATSGPGATNLITGICCSYYDSVPVLYITGQVATFRLKADSGVRQFGFQETEIVEMCQPITKYAVLIRDPKKIRYELEKAVYLARSGRPGPVLVDIPDNLQREEIDPDALESFRPPEIIAPKHSLAEQVSHVAQLLRAAKRPVLIYGFGIRLAKAADEAHEFLKLTGLPVLPTWGAVDLVDAKMKSYVGTFGLHGTRYGNFAVQNADLVLSIGSRLDTHETGSPLSTFARGAKKIIVDIDKCELQKFAAFGLDVDVLIEADAKVFLQLLLQEFRSPRLPSIEDWHETIAGWRRQFAIGPAPEELGDKMNPYVFVKALSNRAKEKQTIVIDTGCAIAWFMQAFEPKSSQCVFSALNNTPMGYALPAAVGATFAQTAGSAAAPVLCLVGDGGFMMNIQELATIARHRLPIKIFVINNGGYSMIQQTQDQWLGSRYHASSYEGGLAFPDFCKVAESYGIPAVRLSKSSELQDLLERTLNHDGPILCDVVFDAAERVIPQVVYGRPLEDSAPLLARDVFLKSMIIEPLEVSKKDL